MEQFKCPMCGELQNILQIEWEVVGATDEFEIGDNIESMIRHATIGIEADCPDCSYSGSVDSFEIVNELTEEEQNELDARTLEGQLELEI